MSSPRAVLWDMDGTLIDSEEFHWISCGTPWRMRASQLPTSNFFPPSDSAMIPSFPGGLGPHRLLSA